MGKKKKTREASTEDDGDAVVIELDHPIEFGGETTTVLTVRPLKAKWLRGLNVSEERSMDMLLTLAERLTGKLGAIINELKGDDLRAVLEAVSDFLERSLPGAGKTL